MKTILTFIKKAKSKRFSIVCTGSSGSTENKLKKRRKAKEKEIKKEKRVESTRVWYTVKWMHFRKTYFSLWRRSTKTIEIEKKLGRKDGSNEQKI